MADTNCDDSSVPISPSLSKELHDLNITLTRKKPWWNENGSLVVAAMAFILSLVVAGISALTSYNKDIHDQQIQLATVTQQIADLEIKAVELAAKYKDDPVTQVQINDLLFAQHATLLQDAGDIATRLGTNSTSSALITIAQRDLNLGSIEEAHRLLLLALSAARTPVDTWAALRNLGFVEIRYATSPEPPSPVKAG